MRVGAGVSPLAGGADVMLPDVEGCMVPATTLHFNDAEW